MDFGAYFIFRCLYIKCVCMGIINDFVNWSATFSPRQRCFFSRSIRLSKSKSFRARQAKFWCWLGDNKRSASLLTANKCVWARERESESECGCECHCRKTKLNALKLNCLRPRRQQQQQHLVEPLWMMWIWSMIKSHTETTRINNRLLCCHINSHMKLI